MQRRIVGSILHGAYGDLYEQALCLKHFVATHPDTELRLFAATSTRLEAFSALDFSFAASFQLWTAIEQQPEIDTFFQFQVHDAELKADVLAHLPESVLRKIDREHAKLPWLYMRDHRLIPERGEFRLSLSEHGKRLLPEIAAQNNIPEDVWSRPTISFLWRYRTSRGGPISSFGQKKQSTMVEGYSGMFQRLIDQFGCHILICGMNLVTDETNRARTDNKYPPFGLQLPATSVTYMKGLSWPLELELASRATASCGHASGFTEGLWLRRGGGFVLMDPPPHYVAKAAYHRMPLFHLNRPGTLLGAMLRRSPKNYGRRLERMLRDAAHTR